MIAKTFTVIQSVQLPSSQKPDSALNPSADPGLQQVFDHLSATLERDSLVRQVTSNLQKKLGVDRVVLYYFYSQWKGRVTFEVLSDPQFSIFGSTGPDNCFNDEYAELYLAGRVRAIADIEAEPIADCHRDFLRNLQVRANLVVPVLIPNGLWGLLVAHHCQSAHPWTDADIAAMQREAETLALAPSIRGEAADR